MKTDATGGSTTASPVRQTPPPPPMLLLLLLLHPLALAMVDFSPSAALDLCRPRVSRLASRVTYTAMLQNTCNEFVGALKPKDPAGAAGKTNPSSSSKRAKTIMRA